MPNDWNENDEIYVLNYSLDSKGFELKILTADDSLIINLMVFQQLFNQYYLICLLKRKNPLNEQLVLVVRLKITFLV